MAATKRLRPMMEVKIQCGCGTRYKFDWEPASGLLPAAVQCPRCGGDGTTAASQIIQQSRSASPDIAAPGLAASPSRGSLRVSASTGETVHLSEPAPAQAAPYAAG